ncbi:hypothetical protein [uncultured Castellaniella sp.]|jgi:hypothetical protein|uniref:hypothetical protein n=1 Tax=uncultured Castellaniella sp. TaxID=647907 RepID=UPI0026017F5E|nr:hypothetical protein [uncultured Castellaniella sp.]
MSRIHLTVLIHEDWRDRYRLVVERCRQAGLDVERELATIGAIAGSIEEDHLTELSTVEGVCAVEPERTNVALQREPRGPGDEKGGR